MQQKTFDLNSLNGINGFIVPGVTDHLGYAVNTVGDINGDGISDLVLGATSVNSYSGAAYVIFGSRAGFGSAFDLTSLNGTNGFAIVKTEAAIGRTVSSAGDINGDGLSDLLLGGIEIGPQRRANWYPGSAYVIFGSRDLFPAVFNLYNSLNGMNGFMIPGLQSGDDSGQSLSTAGDVNGDGLSDIVLGARYANANAGASYVIFGTRAGFTPSFDLSTLNGTNGFTVPGLIADGYLGSSVGTAGDLNGDGLSDLVLGAPYANLNTGMSYVIFGSQGRFDSPFNLTNLNGTNGFTIPGVAEGDQLGNSVNNAGDFNGDGLGDLVLGAYNASSAVSTSAGASYVVFGSRAGFESSFNLSNLNGTNGFTIPGIAEGHQLGNSVSTAGDVNGDGVNDLLLAGYNATSSLSTSAGVTYLIFGSSRGFQSSFNLTNLNGTNGFSIPGLAAGDSLVYSVSTAGDVNGDGISDFVLGTPYASLNAGISYIIFGGIHFIKNELTITQGQTLVLTLNDLNAFSFGRFDLLLFTATNVQGGRFEWTSQPGIPLFNFTKQQIVDGQIRFVSDRSAKVAYAVSVNDASLSIGPVAANVIFTNYAPLVAKPLMDQVFKHDRLFTFGFLANETFVDPDGDFLTFSAASADGTSLPNWIQFYKKDNQLNFTGVAPLYNLATWQLSLLAKDLLNVTTKANFTIAFINNPPVVVKPLLNQVFKHDRPFLFSALANETFFDADGDVLTFSMTSADGTVSPNWIQFDLRKNNTLNLTGIAPFRTLGTREFTLFATDLLNTTQTNFTISFVNNPPLVTSQVLVQPKVVEIGKHFSFTFETNTIFTDPDDDPLTFLSTASDGTPLPHSVQFDASIPNQLTFSGTSSEVGNARWRLFASDPLNETVYGDFSVVTVASNVVHAGASMAEIAGAVVGGLFGLGALAAAGLGFWRYATDKSSRQGEQFASYIREALNLKGVDNFKDHENGKKYIVVVSGLIQALQESGIDPSGMRPAELRELANDVAVAARSTITHGTDCWGRSVITVYDLNNKTQELVSEVQMLRTAGAREKTHTFLG